MQGNQVAAHCLAKKAKAVCLMADHIRSQVMIYPVCWAESVVEAKIVRPWSVANGQQMVTFPA